MKDPRDPYVAERPDPPPDHVTANKRHARAAVLKHRGFSEQTLATIAQARADCEAERARVKASTGLEIEPDGTLRMSREAREALQRRNELEAIETLYQIVREYGSARVSIWLAAVALRAGERL